MDLISIGEQLIDFLPGDEPGSYIRVAGGAPANLAIAAARNGLKTGFIGKVGEDDFGYFLQQTLKDNKVSVLTPERTELAVTTMAFVTLADNGERSFTFARKPGADMFLTKEEIPLAELDQATIVHAGSCSLSKGSTADATKYAIQYAKAQGKITSFDVNYRDPLWDSEREAAKASVQELLPYLDWIKVSDEEVDFLGSAEEITELVAKDTGPSLVVITLGAHGAKAIFKGGEITVDAVKANAIDTTGAGDAFWGAFLANLFYADVRSAADLTSSVIREALRYGTVSGALCVQAKGALASLPTRAEILAELEEK